MDDHKGFFGALFDFTFTDFITTKIIKLLYILLLIVAGVGTLIAVVSTFGCCGVGWGLLTLLILAPLGFVVAVICIRVYMEIIIVLFRIAENTTLIAKSHESKTPPETTET